MVADTRRRVVLLLGRRAMRPLSTLSAIPCRRLQVQFGRRCACSKLRVVRCPRPLALRRSSHAGAKICSILVRDVKRRTTRQRRTATRASTSSVSYTPASATVSCPPANHRTLPLEGRFATPSRLSCADRLPGSLPDRLALDPRLLALRVHSSHALLIQTLIAACLYSHLLMLHIIWCHQGHTSSRSPPLVAVLFPCARSAHTATPHYAIFVRTALVPSP